MAAKKTKPDGDDSKPTTWASQYELLRAAQAGKLPQLLKTHRASKRMTEEALALLESFGASAVQSTGYRALEKLHKSLENEERVPRGRGLAEVGETREYRIQRPKSDPERAYVLVPVYPLEIADDAEVIKVRFEKDRVVVLKP